jgi:hypothetical protein
MNADIEKSAKSRINLSLSADTILQGESLQRVLCRPSFTNLVEALIAAEHKRQFPGQPTQPQPEPQTQQETA